MSRGTDRYLPGEDGDLSSPEAEELFAAYAASLPLVRPSAGLRDRLLAAVTPSWERFLDRVASLADLPLATMRAVLTRAERGEGWEPSGIPGMDLFHIAAGPATAGADVGLVRLAPGAAQPWHSHLGDERVLVITGAYVDSNGERVGPGELAERGVEVRHALEASEEGVMFLVVLYDGVAFDNPAGGPPIVVGGRS